MYGSFTRHLMERSRFEAERIMKDAADKAKAKAEAKSKREAEERERDYSEFED